MLAEMVVVCLHERHMILYLMLYIVCQILPISYLILLFYTKLAEEAE